MTDDERGKKTAQQQLVPNPEGNVMVDVIMGPYRGNRLTMTEADGQSAINNHWAVDASASPQPDDPDHPPHPPLTDEERTSAHESATTWAQLQWNTAQGNPVINPLAKKDRAMKPEEAEGYKTRQMETQPPKHPEPPRR